jgi:ABC-type Fe3+ transport system substrate-binding protein
MEAAPGRLLRVAEDFAFAVDHGQTWAAVEGIRLREEGVDRAVAEVASLLRQSEAERASWWLTELSTPSDLEERLLAAGLTRDEADYLHAAMVLTTEPPAVDVEARRVESLAEYVEARRLALDVFANPHMRAPTDAQLAREWEQLADPVYAAWVDGRMASVGRAIFTRVGAFLMGGASAEWARGRGAYRAVVRARWDAAVERGTPALAVGAGPLSRPILERLGFVQVLQFRRLESVRSRP